MEPTLRFSTVVTFSTTNLWAAHATDLNSIAPLLRRRMLENTLTNMVLCDSFMGESVLEKTKKECFCLIFHYVYSWHQRRGSTLAVCNEHSFFPCYAKKKKHASASFSSVPSSAIRGKSGCVSFSVFSNEKRLLLQRGQDEEHTPARTGWRNLVKSMLLHRSRTAEGTTLPLLARKRFFRQSPHMPAGRLASFAS